MHKPIHKPLLMDDVLSRILSRIFNVVGLPTIDASPVDGCIRADKRTAQRSLQTVGLCSSPDLQTPL